MEGLAFQLEHQFEVVSCCNCQQIFAVPGVVRRRWQEKGTTFYCPNGHAQHYTESDVQKLQKQLADEKRRREWYERNAADERAARERTQRRLIAAKGQQTKLRNRVKNGVCPCCTRTFMNLQQHMKTQHPEFQAESNV